MGRACTICARDDRIAIDKALVGGAPYRDLAERFPGVSESSISRHRKTHITPGLAKLAAAREVKRGATLLERLEDLIDKASQVMDAAEGSSKLTVVLSAIQQQMKMLELRARVTGELDERPQTLVVNLTSTAEWIDLQQRILGALGSFPDAYKAVRLAIGGADHGG